MKKIFVCTIFPELIHNYIHTSILKQAQTKELVKIDVLDIRHYATNTYRQVDDYQYGGGAGMVLMAPPIQAALATIPDSNRHVILLSPRGAKLDQAKAQQLSQMSKNLVFLCGHYEGIDERINCYVDEYLSIGDYVLTSGELAALVVLDAIVRLVPRVIKPDSLISESFNDFLLDHPVYTKPQIFENQAVPAVLLSGHHAQIAAFRHEAREKITKKYRPDLYRKYLKTIFKK